MLNMPHAVGVDEPQATSRRLLAQVTVVMRVDLRYRAPRLVRIFEQCCNNAKIYLTLHTYSWYLLLFKDIGDYATTLNKNK